MLSIWTSLKLFLRYTASRTYRKIIDYWTADVDLGKCFPQMHLLFTKGHNFRLVQMERICRRQNK